MKKNYQMNYLVNFVWGNNMKKRKSIITENNELITTLLVQKKDLEKIIEFTFDLTGEIKQIYDANLNLDSDEYIEITSPDIISFIMNINWIIDEDTYNRFSISELEIAFKQILNILENIKEKYKKNENIDIKKYLELEFKKYSYMLKQIDSLYSSKKNVKNF